MRRTLSTALCILVATASSAVADDAKELAKFEGTWAFVSNNVNGKADTADTIKVRTLVIKSGKLTVVLAGLEQGGATLKLVDVAATPAQIDWEWDDPARGKVRKGIYKFESDKIVLCFGKSGNDRPTAFESKEGSGVALMEIKKAAFEEVKGWGTFVDPAGDCKVLEKDGKVTITVPGTHHDLNPTPNFDNVLAPRILKEREGDFTVQVQVNSFPVPPANSASTKAGIPFVGAGILIWQDKDNFIRFLRGSNGNDGVSFSSLEAFLEGKQIGSGFTTRIDSSKKCYLKAERKENTFTLAISSDGKDWETIRWRSRRLKEIELSKKVKVGVAAINATKNEFAPVFEEFSLVGK